MKALEAPWMDGDHVTFARYFEPGALEILGSLPTAPGNRMLDVACGAGQIAIPAAGATVKVTGVDIATNLIEQARARSAAEGLTIQFEEGDAEQLAFPDSSFVAVVRLVGAMFAPRRLPMGCGATPEGGAGSNQL